MKRTSAALLAISFIFATSAFAAEYGTEAEAKAMLDRVVAEVKADPAGALQRFNTGAEGFRDRDLYPFCIGPDGMMSAHPTLLGKPAAEIKDANGKLLAEEMLEVAEEGEIKTVEYVWPRPGSDEPLPKVSFVTKIGDQICGVGYYK